ncbi:MAG TPA: WHG domain-containing protein [Ktedonobacteraceae bacterium]
MSPRAGLGTQTVIEAATALVDELGADQLSLALLAQRLGVRKPSLYNHISSLASLKYQVAVQSKREILSVMTRALADKSGLDAMFALAEAYRAYAQAHPGLYALAEQLHASEKDAELLAVEEAIFACVRTVVAPYQLSAEEINTAILGVRSIIEGFLSLELAGNLHSTVDLAQAFHQVIQAFFKGIVPLK